MGERIELPCGAILGILRDIINHFLDYRILIITKFNDLQHKLRQTNRISLFAQLIIHLCIIYDLTHNRNLKVHQLSRRG